MFVVGSLWLVKLGFLCAQELHRLFYPLFDYVVWHVPEGEHGDCVFKC